MSETKVIDISKLKTQECVYVSWYQFKQCTIRTCRNYTAATSSHCLAIDRAQPLGNKIISDAELHLFKFGSAGVSTRLISIKRKKAVARVKAMLILNEFIEYIRGRFKPDERYWSNPLVEQLELAYPLRVMRLGYMNWMLPYLTSEKTYTKFATKKGGECGAFKVHTLLGMTEMKFMALRKSIKTPTTDQPKEEKHEPKPSEANPARPTQPRSVHNAAGAGKVRKLLRVGVKQLKSTR